MPPIALPIPSKLPTTLWDCPSTFSANCIMRFSSLANISFMLLSLMSTSKAKAPLLLSTTNAVYIVNEIICILLCKLYAAIIKLATSCTVIGRLIVHIIACLVCQHTLHNSPRNTFCEILPRPMKVCAYSPTLPIEAI